LGDIKHLVQPPAPWQKFAFYALMAGLSGILAAFLPAGFDYVHVFAPHLIPIFYVPWIDGVMYWLSWPVLVSVTILALMIAVDRHNHSSWTILLVIFSLPTIWVLLLGQLEGVALLGLLLMPWSIPVWLLDRWRRFARKEWIVLILLAVTTAGGVIILSHSQGSWYYEPNPTLGQQPLVAVALGLLLPWWVPVALLKPQLAAFAMLAHKNWFIVAAAWLMLSIVIWGFWPLNLLTRIAPEIKAVQPQDVSLFPWSLIVALPLLWLSRGDADRLMAAGSLAVPTVQPYQYIVLMPALARLPVRWRLLCWLCSFLPLTANYFGPQFWLTGNIFPLIMWFGLWKQRRLTSNPTVAVHD
jgi:hypothetical protein